MNKKDKLDLFEVEQAIEANTQMRIQLLHELNAKEDELAHLEKMLHKLQVHKTTLMIKMNEEESNNG